MRNSLLTLHLTEQIISLEMHVNILEVKIHQVKNICKLLPDFGTKSSFHRLDAGYTAHSWVKHVLYNSLFSKVQRKHAFWFYHPVNLMFTLVNVRKKEKTHRAECSSLLCARLRVLHLYIVSYFMASFPLSSSCAS